MIPMKQQFLLLWMVCCLEAHAQFTGRSVLGGNEVAAEVRPPATIPRVRDMEDMQTLKEQKMPFKAPGEDQGAIIRYLNTDENIPAQVREKAIVKLRKGTEMVYGGDDIYPIGGLDLAPGRGGFLPGTDSPTRAPFTQELQRKTEELGKSVGLILPSYKVEGLPETPSVEMSRIGVIRNLCLDVAGRDRLGIEDTGTGFLISPTLVATAGHCAEKLGATPRIIFGYTQTAFDISQAKRTGKTIFFGTEAVIRNLRLVAGTKRPDFEAKGDWAIYEIIGNPTGLTPLELNDGPRLTPGNQNLVMIGHPCGYPLSAAVKGNMLSSEGYNFWTNLDAFIGNSGSPIFNASTWKVEGLLISGGTDFDKVKEQLNCFTWMWDGRWDGKPPKKVGEAACHISRVVEARNSLLKK